MKSHQLVMERTENHAGRMNPTTSGIGTILLQVLDDDRHDARLNAALSLARACSAHLSCVHVTPIEAYVAFDSFGGVFVMNDIIKALDEHDTKLKTTVEGRLGGEDVSWDYEQVTGNVESALVSRAALADLLIAAREKPRDFVGPTIGLLGELLCRSRAPLMIPGSEQEFDPNGPALIAWNGSIEAANAVRSSLGLLSMASEVTVLEVTEKKLGAKAFPATRLLEYLSRRGVHAELDVEPSPMGHVGHEVVAGMILAQASAKKAAYIVMGGYSHNRMGEFVFGGVTRTLLQESPVSLVVAR